MVNDLRLACTRVWLAQMTGTERSCVYEVLSNEDCSVSGHKILDLYNIGTDKFGVRLAAVMIIIAMLRILAWLTLRLRRIG
jgi:hypothetical protein